jgi:hypothetical protein
MIPQVGRMGQPRRIRPKWSRKLRGGKMGRMEMGEDGQRRGELKDEFFIWIYMQGAIAYLGSLIIRGRNQGWDVIQ